eukprot:3341903-Pleurochrysis_carterae.AAC.1
MIGASASRLAMIASSSRERARGVSVVGALDMVGVWNSGVASPNGAVALASGDVGWRALEASSAAMLVYRPRPHSRD